MKIDCIILAGGEGPGTGAYKDKAFIELSGRPLISYVLGAVKSFFLGVIVVVKNKNQKDRMEKTLWDLRNLWNLAGRGGKPAAPQISVVADNAVEQSAVTSIRAGLSNSTATHAFVVSCGMPFIDGVTVFALLNKARPSVDCVAYKTGDRVKIGDKSKKYETMCAIYSRQMIENLDDTTSLQNSIDELDDTKKVIVVAYEKKQFFSIDTAEDLEKAESMTKKRESGK